MLAAAEQRGSADTPKGGAANSRWRVGHTKGEAAKGQCKHTKGEAAKQSIANGTLTALERRLGAVELGGGEVGELRAPATTPLFTCTPHL